LNYWKLLRWVSFYFRLSPQERLEVVVPRSDLAKLQQELRKAMEKQDYHAMKMIYFDQALIWYEEGAGFQKLLRESNKWELMKLKRTGVIEKVEILSAGSRSCEACQKLEGKIFTIQEALEKMPIPHDKCTLELNPDKPGWCRCEYIAVID
jgi:hypothetical protein